MNLYEGSSRQGVAGARRVGRPLRDGQLGLRPLSGPFVSGRVLVRRREDRRVRVEHSVRPGCSAVLRCVSARDLETTMMIKKDFLFALLATLSTCHQPATRWLGGFIRHLADEWHTRYISLGKIQKS